MRTQAGIEKRISQVQWVLYFPVMLFVGAAAAFLLDGSWEHGEAAGFAACLCLVLGNIRLALLTRELRLAKLGLSDD